MSQISHRNCFLFIWNSNLNGHPVFLFAKSGSAGLGDGDSPWLPPTCVMKICLCKKEEKQSRYFRWHSFYLHDTENLHFKEKEKSSLSTFLFLPEAWSLYHSILFSPCHRPFRPGEEEMRGCLPSLGVPPEDRTEDSRAETPQPLPASSSSPSDFRRALGSGTCLPQAWGALCRETRAEGTGLQQKQC